MWLQRSGKSARGQKDGKGRELSYECDALGNVTEVTYSDGRKASYTYDALDHMTSVTDLAGKTTVYVYDTDGNLTGAKREDGKTLYTYDKAGNLVKEEGSEERHYLYDACGRLTAVTDKDNLLLAALYDGHATIYHLSTGTAAMAGMALKPYVMPKQNPVLAGGEQENIAEKAAMGANDAAGGVEGSTPINKIPENDSIIKHIFKDATGHIPDTPENRALLEEIANNAENFRGIDRYGNEWYTRILEDGREVWVESRNGNIFEGGINEIPKPWNPETGLKINNPK